MADEWGLLTEAQVRAVLRADRPPIEPLDDDASMLRVRVDGACRYPGFQFDFEAGSVREWVSSLMQMAGEMGRSPEGVAVWMITPTTFLGLERNRPVDHAGDTGLLLEVARRSWDHNW